MEVGSDEHKELFCRAFIDSHLTYEPENLSWPHIDERSLAFLHAVPVWASALEVEINAGHMLQAFAATQSDPLIREALQLQSYEESRHGRMLRALFDRYGIPVAAAQPSPGRGRGAFVSFGYDECVDSFFGFGIFRIAKELHVVTDSLIDVFARVLAEEARHIVFFVNWIAYDRTRRGFRGPMLHALPTVLGYAQAMRKTIRRGKSADVSEQGMASAMHVFAGLTLEKFMRTCLEENERYMAAFDPRLLRPKFVPALVRGVMRILPRTARTSAIVTQTADSVTKTASSARRL